MWAWLKTNHQVLTAVGAMFVGAAALFIAWDQARVMRAQQHGAVVPALQVDAFTRTDEGVLSVGLRVANNGVGPAFIRDITVLRDGHPVSEIDGMFAALPAPQDRSWFNMTDRVIAPGDTVTPIAVDWPMDVVTGEAIAAMFAEWERWDTEICYCSVFDRCWIATVQHQNRRQVASCPAPGDDVFERFGAQPFLNPDTTPEPAGAEQ